MLPLNQTPGQVLGREVGSVSAAFQGPRLMYAEASTQAGGFLRGSVSLNSWDHVCFLGCVNMDEKIGSMERKDNTVYHGDVQPMNVSAG